MKLIVDIHDFLSIKLLSLDGWFSALEGVPILQLKMFLDQRNLLKRDIELIRWGRLYLDLLFLQSQKTGREYHRQ